MRPIGSLTRRTRRRGMIWAGLVGLAAFSLSILSHPRPQPAVQIVVARTALAAGTVLHAADLMIESMPAPGIRHGLVPKQALGRSLAFGVAAHQPLVAGDVARSPELAGLKSNEVAMMLPVSLASSDMVQPNDRVNVIWLGGSSATSSATTAGTVIATGLRVLSVLNQNGSPVTPEAAANGLNASTPAVVNVAVPQAAAGTLAVAASAGRFWLALNPWAGPQDATVAVANQSPSISAVFPSIGGSRSLSRSPSSPTNASKTRAASPQKASPSKTSSRNHA